VFGLLALACHILMKTIRLKCIVRAHLKWSLVCLAGWPSGVTIWAPFGPNRLALDEHPFGRYAIGPKWSLWCPSGASLLAFDLRTGWLAECVREGLSLSSRLLSCQWAASVSKPLELQATGAASQ